MYSLRFAVLVIAAALTGSSSALAENRQTEHWIYYHGRAVPQEGLEHQVCSTDAEELVFCFEFMWLGGSLGFWVTLNFLDDSPRRFEDGMATDFWIDDKIHGSNYRGKLTGSTNSMLDMDRFLGANREEYYFYGGSWIFFRQGVAAPSIFLSNKRSFFYKLTKGSHLRLVHYLEGGETFETEYDMEGLAPFLLDLHTEAAAMEATFGKPQVAED